MKIKYTGKNKFRRFIHRYSISILSFLLFELFAVHSRYDINIVNRHKNLMNKAFKGVVCLVQFIKMRFTTDDFTSIPFEELVKDENTVYQLKNLFFEDVIKDYAEVGGIITLNEENGNSTLKFYEIEDKYSDFMRNLIKYENDWKGFIDFYEKNKKTFEEIEKKYAEQWDVDFIRGKASYVIKNVLRKTEESEDVKLKVLQSLIRMYKLMRDNSYSVDIGKYLSENIIDGKFLGYFHLHTVWMEPPSENDLEKSKDYREFVFTLNENGFDVYILEKGEIVNTIHYRDDSWNVFFKTLKKEFKKKGYMGGYLF